MAGGGEGGKWTGVGRQHKTTTQKTNPGTTQTTYTGGFLKGQFAGNGGGEGVKLATRFSTRYG